MRQHIATLTFNASPEEHITIITVATEEGYALETPSGPMIKGKFFKTLQEVEDFIRWAYRTPSWGLRMIDKE